MTSVTGHEGGDDSEKITLTRGELKEEVRKEIRRESRRRFYVSCALYLVFLTIMLGLPFLLLAGIAAKSGLFQVPVLSGWLYEPSAPTRIVVPLAGSGPDAILASMAAKASYDRASGIAEMSLTEQELTTLLSASVAEAAASGTLPIPLESMQAVLLADGTMELYAVTERKGNQAPVILTVTPNVVNGGLDLRTENFLIGAFDVPDFMTDLVLSAFARSVTDSLESGLSSVGTLDDIMVEEGKLRIYLAPKQ